MNQMERSHLIQVALVRSDCERTNRRSNFFKIFNEILNVGRYFDGFLKYHVINRMTITRDFWKT